MKSHGRRHIGPQLHAKTEVDGIIIDPVEEIFSNKLTTLVSRQEVRDLVDVFELENHGLRAEDFLAEANAKDGGCTPATLAWLLAEWRIPPNAKLPWVHGRWAPSVQGRIGGADGGCCAPAPPRVTRRPDAFG